MEKTIVDALYFEMTGTSSKQSKEIPLTIKRDDDNFQNVLITTGSLKKSDLKIVMKNCSNEFEDSCNKNNVILKICNDEEFKLNLPMILYFGEIANGAVSTISNPSLTHGLSKLKAILEKNCVLNSDDDSISIIVNNTNDSMDIKIYIDEDKLYID
jgi:hypothetical protein